MSGGFAECLERNQNNLWIATWATLRNTFWGFLVGVGSGVAVGLVLGRSEFLAKVFEPFIIAFNSLAEISLMDARASLTCLSITDSDFGGAA